MFLNNLGKFELQNFSLFYLKFLKLQIDSLVSINTKDSWNFRIGRIADNIDHEFSTKYSSISK